MSTVTPRRSRSGTAPATEPRSTRAKSTPKSKTKSSSKSNNLTAPQSAKSSRSRSRSSSKASDSESQELAVSLDDTSSDSTDQSRSQSTMRRSPRLTSSQESTEPSIQPRPVSPIVRSPPEPAPFATSGKVARTPMKRLTHSKNHKSLDQPNDKPIEHSNPIPVNHSNQSLKSSDQPSSLLETNQEALTTIPSPHHSPIESNPQPVKRSAQDVTINQSNSQSVKTPTSGKKRKSAHLETADEFIDEPIDQLEYNQPHTIPASLEDNLSPINHPIHHSPIKQSASKHQTINRTPTKHQTINHSPSKPPTDNIPSSQSSSQTINESNNHSIAHSPSQSPRSPRRTSIARTPQPQPEQLIYPSIFPDVDQFVDQLLNTLDERINTSTHTLLAALNTTNRPKDQIEAISKHVYDSVGETFDLTRPRWAEFVKKIVFSISEEEKYVIDSALESPSSISNEEMSEAEIAEQELDEEISQLQESILTNHAILQQKREQLSSIESQLSQHEQIRALFADASPARAAAFQAKFHSIKKAWIQFQQTLQQAKETKTSCQWSETTTTEMRTVKAAVTYQPDMIETDVLKSMTMKNAARLPV